MSVSVAIPAAKALTGASSAPRLTTGAMSIAIYLHDLSGGGVERQSLIIAEEFRRYGADVTLVLHSLRGQLLDQVPPGLRIVGLSGSRTLHDIPALVRFLRRDRPDILLTNLDLNNVAALLAKAVCFRRTKVVLCQHNPISDSFVACENWLYRYVGLAYRLLGPLISQAVAVSHGVARELHTLAGVPASRIVTINNPVVGPDFAERCREEAAHPWFEQRDTPVFVTAGRLVPQKDHATMLRALAVHRQAGSGRLIVLGIGPLEQELRILADKLGIAAAVDFLGFRTNALPYFRQADAFLLSSRCEGFGNVLVEALGCGTPVISTSCEHGPAEILDGGRYGALVPPGDVVAMAAAMDQVATLRQRFPEEALIERANAFSYAACASRYMSAFRAILPNRAVAG